MVCLEMTRYDFIIKNKKKKGSEKYEAIWNKER